MQTIKRVLNVGLSLVIGYLLAIVLITVLQITWMRFNPAVNGGIELTCMLIIVVIRWPRHQDLQRV